jgi:hypothetical protein
LKAVFFLLELLKIVIWPAFFFLLNGTTLVKASSQFFLLKKLIAVFENLYILRNLKLILRLQLFYQEGKWLEIPYLR